MSDTPPQEQTEDREVPSDACRVRPVAIDAEQYRKMPIQLGAYDWATFTITVPWFPKSLWVVDLPEGHWGPFPGANDWPYQPEEVWKTEWQISDDRTRLEYARKDGNQTLRVTVTARGDEVLMRMEGENLGEMNLGAICIKTFSPFFSSQERLTANRIEGDSLVRACDLPLPSSLSASLGWDVGDNLPHGAMVMKSYDGTAHVAIAGAEGAACGGNGWPHCSHVRGDAMMVEKEGEVKMTFAVGSFEELLKRL